ncbi:acyl carrier protein [Novosphingobium album (ex Liu et al. 2023)]|uniref:Acyl carrier protein n=1 Tax=Novosphingobium album (ex Liu et al. 2023) TaxID=3031130 RepID=A0ABT5WQ91_9SPHN|nr:acyl carrier protein [Novosphingobium album (ex Liu et al. 2023)]MDE8652207.1 acyl carrier protein [Novosphingobium album (ex Liu et al. 2023)]
MERDEISAIIGEIMCDVFDLEELKYDDALSADDIEEWDSLSHIRFIVSIEKRFGLVFSSAEIEHLQNVGEMVDAVKQKLSK